MGDLSQKKKPRVAEIDGVLWQLDDFGKKVKKMKRKAKTTDAGVVNPSTLPLSPKKLNQKESIREINGVLYRLDERGVPIKKIRRKNGEGGRVTSPKPNNDADRQLLLSRMLGSQVLRAQSTGAPIRRQPGEYTDSKGRRIVVEEDGSETVFDKNGKRLRPKKKDLIDEMRSEVGGRANSERFRVSHNPWKSPVSINGNRGKSEGFSNSTFMTNPLSPTARTKHPVNKHEIAATLSEIDRENIELKMKLVEAKDQAADLTNKVLKEKQKNVKATTESNELRGKNSQTEEHSRTLALKIKNLEARLLEMDAKIDMLKSIPFGEEVDDNGGTNKDDHLVTQITQLRLQNLSLLNKLDAQKVESSNEAKKKSEQIILLNDKVKKLRSENDKIFGGQTDVEFFRIRLMQEKKELTERLEEVKLETRTRIDEMQVTVDGLQQTNNDLKSQVGKATLEINAFDDDETRLAKEMAQAVAQHGTRNAARAKRTSINLGNGTLENQRLGFGFGSLSALANASISNIAS
jgi:hypothetical protein